MPARASNPARLGLRAILAGIIVAKAGTAWAVPQPVGPRQRYEEDSSGLIATLLDGGAARGARDTAADRLLALADRPPVVQALVTVIEAPIRHEAQDILLAAISRSSSPPGALAAPLEAALLRAQYPAPFMRAIAPFRTRAAIGAILARAGDGEAAEARAAACESLAWSTGRHELAGDLQRWRDWYASIEWLSEPDWRQELVEGLASNAARLARERTLVGQRLSDSQQALYFATPEGPPRVELLARFIADPLDEIRTLGMSLAAREIAAGTHLDGPVTAAAIALLRDPRAPVRAEAARLIDQIAPDGRASQVLDALAAESDPQAAASLLRAVSRWPDRAMFVPVSRWLAGPPVARRAAAEAALAMDDAGLIDGEKAASLRQALQAIPLEDLSDAEAALTCRVGTDDDRRRVAGVLDVPGSPARLSTANLLADDPEYFDRVMSAAASDPALFEAAVRAVRRSRPDARGYAAIASLPAESEALRTGALIDLAYELAPTELVGVASESKDSEFREDVLSRLATPIEFGPVLDASQMLARQQGIRMLARARLDLGRASAALAALESLPPDDPEAEDLRVIAWLGLGRIDAAGERAGTIDAWLEGLEAAIVRSTGNARAIADTIRARGDLSPEQLARLLAIEEHGGGG